MSSPTDHRHTVEVDAPVRVAYNQWTQFEEFIEDRDAATGAWRGTTE